MRRRRAVSVKAVGEAADDEEAVGNEAEEARIRVLRRAPDTEDCVLRRQVEIVMPYEKFDAWRATHELALEVYRITENWPTSERYQLTSQTRRAALSVPTNIAEGAAKRGPREFRRYLDISLGSLSELSYLLRFGKDLGLLDTETYSVLDQLRDRAGRLTWRLYACMLRARSPR